MGKYGLKSGYGNFQNIQAGRAYITTDSSGDGSTDITFATKMKNVPSIVCTAQTSDDTITFCTTDPSVSGFTMEYDGAATTGSSFYASWVAMDDTKTSQM